MKQFLQRYFYLAIIPLLPLVMESCGAKRFAKLTYSVKDGQHMLMANEIVADTNNLNKEQKKEAAAKVEEIAYDMSSVIRQQPNISKLRVRCYNWVDSAKVEKKQAKLKAEWVDDNRRLARKDSIAKARRISKAENEFQKDLPKIKKINDKRKKRAKRVNDRREERLTRKNANLLRKQAKYKDKRGHVILKKKKPHKYIPYEPELLDTIPMYKPKNRVFRKYKDTSEVRHKLRYRVKYKFGENPVIADTAAMTKTLKQMRAFLNAKGYYYAKVNGSFAYYKSARKAKRTKAVYTVTLGPRFYIDSVFLKTDNAGLESVFKKKFLPKDDAGGLNTAVKDGLDGKSVLIPFDAFKLDAYRYEIASTMTEYKYYGFTEQNVYFKVDTARVRNSGDYRMKLTIGFSKRLVQDAKGNTKQVAFEEAMVKRVNFYISDTTYMDGYSDLLRNQYDSLLVDSIKGLKYKNYPTLNLYVYNELLKKVENKDDGTGKKTYYKSKIHKGLFGGYKDSIGVDPLRVAYFHYNGELFVNPGLLECQNYLESTNYFKQYYIERSYTRMQQLGLFDEVDMEVVETFPGSAILNVNYHVVPAVRQTFSFQPKGTYINGFFGVSGALNYGTINMFRTGTKANFSIESGFDQNSTIVSDPNAAFFNTIEVAPTVKFDIPGWFPVRKVTGMGKRQRPRTEITTSYNFQKRVDFKRNLFQFGYLWTVSPGTGKNSQVGLGVPGLAAVKFVLIDKEPEFEQRINELNDQFLLNAYSNQLIWEDIRFNITYNNAQDERWKKVNKPNITLSFNGAHAGFVASQIAKLNPVLNAQNQYTIIGVPYSQFWIGDFKLIATQKINRKSSLAYRFMYGIGSPKKNTPTSLPYDYSFSSGGPNDVRGWEARQLGPGAYLSLLDPNAVKTQIGDVRLQSSLEYRFGSGIFKHALFVDAGNTWTYRYDSLRPGSQISNANWFKQLAIGAGYGIRLDFDFFIFRIDFGIPIYQPSLPETSRWIFEKPSAYNLLAKTIYGSDYENILTKQQLKPFRPHLHFGIGLPF